MEDMLARQVAHVLVVFKLDLMSPSMTALAIRAPTRSQAKTDGDLTKQIGQTSSLAVGSSSLDALAGEAGSTAFGGHLYFVICSFSSRSCETPRTIASPRLRAISI